MIHYDLTFFKVGVLGIVWVEWKRRRRSRTRRTSHRPASSIARALASAMQESGKTNAGVEMRSHQETSTTLSAMSNVLGDRRSVVAVLVVWLEWQKHTGGGTFSPQKVHFNPWDFVKLSTGWQSWGWQFWVYPYYIHCQPYWFIHLIISKYKLYLNTWNSVS